jgi:hypothetical protein
LNLSSLTEKTTGCSAQTHVNPKLMLSSIESLRNSEIIPAERNKLCLIKAGKKAPDLSSMRTARHDANITLNPLQCLPL